MQNVENVIRSRFRHYLKIYDKLPVALQNAVVSLRGLFLTRLRYQRLFWQTLSDILDHDSFSPEELEEYQAQLLRSRLQYAYRNIPYYRKQFDAAGLQPEQIRSMDYLVKLPILRRDDIRTHFDSLLQSRQVNGRIVVHTSGSCGAGIPVAYHQRDLARNWAFTFRQFIWADVQPREWRMTLFGSKVVPETQEQPPYWRYNLLERQILLSIYHLSERTSAAYLHFLRKHQGLVLEGFASVLGLVADFVFQSGRTIPMKMVYATGETMDEIQRHKVERAFECKVYDCYGMTEWAGLIQECEKGGKHIISDFGVLEILDEQGIPVATGQEGYLVWTSLQKEEMPLIRYKIGDKGIWSFQVQCECGRPYPLAEPTITRDGDILQTPNGEYFSPRVINQFLKDKVTFAFCQFVQNRQDEVVMRIVPGKGDVGSEARTVAHDLDKLFKGAVRIKIEYQERPRMRGRGKFPLVINQIKREATAALEGELL